MLLKKQISVRNFRLSDLESIKELIKRTIDVCYSGFYFKEVMDYFDMYNWDGNILKVAREGYIVVVEMQGKIIGTGSIMGDVILRVFVDHSHQKQGLGSMIMKELEMRAAANGVEAVQLRALANARKFYESLGYLTVAKGLVEVDSGRQLEYYEMVKSLSVGEGSHSSWPTCIRKGVNGK
jgi:GNAT superfamily N-acetyltransferase